MLTVQVITRLAVSKNHTIGCVWYDNNANGESLNFTVANLTERRFEELLAAFRKGMRNKTFENKAELELAGWRLIQEFKEKRNIFLTSFEYNHLVPEDEVKFLKFSAWQMSGRGSMGLFSYMKLNGEQKFLQIALGIKKLDKKTSDKLAQEVEACVRGESHTDFQSAREAAKKTAMEVLLDMELITEEFHGKAIQGKGHFLNYVRSQRRGKDGRGK